MKNLNKLIINIISFVHEILHLSVLSKGKLNDKCEIAFGKGVASAIYKGSVSRCTVIVYIIGVVFTTGIIKSSFALMLLMTAYGSYTDIYIVFYTLKTVKKYEMIYGLYKK